MDHFIKNNTGYLSDGIQNTNNTSFPNIENLGSNFLCYEKLKICVSILFNKFPNDQELHLQKFLEDLIMIGYNEIYSIIKSLPVTPDYFEQFSKYAHELNEYDTNDQIFYFSNLLIYIGSKNGLLKDPFFNETYAIIADTVEDWFKAKEVPTLNLNSADSLYYTLAVPNNSGIIDRNELLNNAFISENCIHFFKCIQERTYTSPASDRLSEFKKRIFKIGASIQARTFINIIFDFKHDITIKPHDHQDDYIYQFLYREYVNFSLLNSNLEALLRNTFLTQKDLNTLYLQQILDDKAYYKNKPLTNSLNIKFKDYNKKDIQSLQIDLLKNIISLCQTIQQQKVESKYLQVLVNI